ncbi:MAG: hypothetical protein FWH20_07535 [Oscillospiraceae bacterium]|nr:hypothetical protein [Oscillospiraceae bacterium]
MSENIQIAAVEISPIELLMREHGVLRRVLLIYAEVGKKLKCERAINYTAVHHAALQAAEIAKVYVEDFHQELENEHVFPLFREETRFIPVINILLEQHYAATKITADILRILECGVPNCKARPRLLGLMQGYVTMQRHHAAREDTCIFPEVHKLISAEKRGELGAMFAESAEERFGADGFAVITAKLREAEKGLGIYNLGKFTLMQK